MNGHDTVFAVLITTILGVAIPGLVTLAVRHSNQKTSPMAAIGRPGFVVRNRRWQVALLRIVGILFVLVGALLLATGLSGAILGASIAGACMILGGVAFVIGGQALSSYRIEGRLDGLEARSFGRGVRSIGSLDIAIVLPSHNNYGGLRAEDATGHMLFDANRLMSGYVDLISWLQQYRPDLVIPEGSQPLGPQPKQVVAPVAPKPQPGYSPTTGSFTVRETQSTQAPLFIGGALFAVIGLVGLLIVKWQSSKMPHPWTVGVCFAVCYALGMVMYTMGRRGLRHRLVVSGDKVTIHTGGRQTRTINVSEISAIQAKTMTDARSGYSSILLVATDYAHNTLFTADTGMDGFPLLVSWLQQRRPDLVIPSVLC